MQLGWGILTLLCLAGALAWFWQDSLAARESANRAAIEACERLSLQFLDGTVAFSRLSLMRGSDGWLMFRRTYVFDYTANSIERRQGFVVMAGRRVETMGYARDETPRAAAAAPVPPQSGRAQILVLDQWRKSSGASDPDAEPRQSGDTQH